MDDWVRCAYTVGFAYTQTVHTVTKHAPNELNFRYMVPHSSESIPHIPSDDVSKDEFLKHVENNTDQIWYNLRRSKELNNRYFEIFKVGNVVYLDQSVPTPGLSSKLTLPRMDAYRVKGIYPNNHLHDLQSFQTGKVDVYHVDRMRRHYDPQVEIEDVAYESDGSSIDPLPLPEHTSDDVYEVDRLL